MWSRLAWNPIVAEDDLELLGFFESPKNNESDSRSPLV